MGKYIVGFVVVIGLSISTYHFWNLSMQKDEDLRKALAKNKISISDTVIKDVTVLEFLKITSNFNYYHEKKYPSFKVFKDKVQVLYKWPYSFTYGFDLTGKEWDWCVKVVDDDKGVISINAPEIVLTNTNPPAPKVEKTFKKPNRKKSLDALDKDVQDIAQEIINDTAKVHLSDPLTKSSITKAFSKHIQGLFNTFDKSARPITSVEINYTNKCDA